VHLYLCDGASRLIQRQIFLKGRRNHFEKRRPKFERCSVILAKQRNFSVGSSDRIDP
jgi:3-isopropylmalate dehydratase small subunit